VGSVGGSPFTILSKIQNPTPNILQQQYELARIEEVKETPSVVILDEGKSSIEKDTPKRKLIIIISIFFGGGLALTISLLWNTMNGEIIS